MREVVITGIGLVSPIGVEREEFFSALCQGRSGVSVARRTREVPRLPAGSGPGSATSSAKDYVKPRKNIKVMSRDIQMGFVAADKAWTRRRHRRRISSTPIGLASFSAPT